MRRLVTILAVGAAALLSAAVVFIPGAAQADSTIYVSAAGSTLCPNAQFTTLSAAVQYAQPHDTIRICPGIYTVGPATTTAVPATGLAGLVIDKTLQIYGAGAGKTIIEPTQALAEASATDNIRDNLGNIITVQGTNPGDTSDQDVNPIISGVTIRDNGDMVDAGIAFNNAAGTITDSTIGPFTGSTPTAAQPNVGWGVVASNNYAVSPQGAFERDVTVSSDLITGYGGGGVLIDGSESTKPIYFRSGVAETGAITNNTITGAASAASVQQYGVQVNAGARAAITGNTITGNLSSAAGSATNPGKGVGILLTDADVTTNTVGSTTAYFTKISANNLTGNGYGIFNGTADFPGAYSTDPYVTDPIDVNGTGTTPANLPTAANDTTQGGTTATPVPINYDVPGVSAKGVAANYYGTAGPVIGGPSTATADGISESTTTAASADSVPTTNSTKLEPTAAAPGAITDAPPTAAWGTPDGIAPDTTVTGGVANELLVVANDDFGVSSVDINADGTDLGTLTLDPYETSWTPPASLDGSIVPLTATVTDEDGQVTVATINVTVQAPTPPPAVVTTTTTTTTPSTTTSTSSTTTSTPSTTTSTPSTTTSTPAVTVAPVVVAPVITPIAAQFVTAAVTAGNAKVSVVTTKVTAACLATTSRLAVKYTDVVVAGSKKTRLTFVKATISLGGKVRAVARKKSESFSLSLAGLKAGTYTLKVVTTYHYTVGRKTRTFTKTESVNKKVC